MTRKRRKEWFDDESFWRDLYLYMFSDRRFAEAEAEVKKALALLKAPGKSVLDLGCGPGRWTIPLVRRGFQVTGVDRTKYLLQRARANAKKAGIKAEWVLQDMRDFVRPEAFDVALSMFTSFGYFEDEREDMMVLRNLFDSLKPGGVCLIDVAGKEMLLPIFQPTTSVVLEDGARLIERHEVIDEWTRIRNEWILIRKNKVTTFNFDVTLYSGRELKDRMIAAGFRNLKLYGALDGREYGPGAQRLVAVGRKPKAGRKR
jgi:SAM-dependent methyltransferase